MDRVLITAPAVEPVSLTEAKAHLRVDISDDDTYISSLIVAAREHVESSTSRALITQTWEIYFPCMPSEIEVPLPPLVSVTTFDYVDTAGDPQTLASDQYTVVTESEPGRIVPAYGVTWPAARDVPNAVTVRYVAGYGAASTDVPQRLRQAMLLLIGHWYEIREPLVIGPNISMAPITVQSLTIPYRQHWFA